MKNNPSRRKFMLTLAATGTASVLGTKNFVPGKSQPIQHPQLTIQNVIDLIIREITGTPLADTVDVVKIGDASQPVTGITSSFLATCAVIQKAIDLGHNLIIAHEPLFYNHRDDVTWLHDNSIYQFKRQLIEKHKLVIWRCHDYWHTLVPDGILTGMNQILGWESFADKNIPALYHLPETTLADLIVHLKKRLDIPKVCVIGDVQMKCQKIGLLAGAPGGTHQINFAEKYQPDVLLCGEINEWETNIYFQDALFTGRKQALVLLGHQPSEEAGMAWLVHWLKQRLPDLPMTHVPGNNDFQFV